MDIPPSLKPSAQSAGGYLVARTRREFLRPRQWPASRPYGVKIFARPRFSTAAEFRASLYGARRLTIYLP